MILLAIFFFLAIGFSFLCSILEAVLLSITPQYIRQKETESNPIAAKLNEFKEDIDKPLSSILTLNTIAHTVGAIGVGAQASNVFGHGGFELFGMEIAYEGVIAAVMTLAVLILSEIIPKTIGANNWKNLAPFTVKTLNVMNAILKPITWMTSLITKGLKKEQVKSVLSRNDILAMAEAVESDGVIDATDSGIIKNVLNWDQITVNKIMTPKTVILSAEENQTIRAFYDSNNLTFSRIPIYNETKDNVSGYILKDALMEAIIGGNGANKLSSIRRPFQYFQENVLVDDAFHALMDKREHIGLVQDEFGTVHGLVTLEDIMETIIGEEIVDEYDTTADMRKLAKEQAKKSQ